MTTCIRCESVDSIRWWKCCPDHTTERGLDVVCERCAHALHPEADNAQGRTEALQALIDHAQQADTGKQGRNIDHP